MNGWNNIDITTGHNPSRYPQVTNAQLNNFYISNQESGACLLPTPGYKSVNTTFEDTNSRAIFFSIVLGGIIAVFGRNVYLFKDITSSGVIINPDLPLATENGTVFIDENDINQIVLSDGASLYVIVKGTQTKFQLAPIPQGVIPTNIVYLDTYFITSDKLTGKFYISGNNTALTWNPLDFSLINSKTVGVATINRQLLVFGEQETGVYYDAGVVPFPFQRTNTFAIEYGCVSVDSIAQGFGMVCWLAVNKQSDPVLMMSSGGAPKSLSSENIDFIISDLESPQNCDAFMYQSDGHIFYQINFYSDDLTLLYDFTTRKFSSIIEKEVNPSVSNKFIETMSSVQYLTAVGNKAYCLLRDRAFIYEFSNKIPTNDGHQIPRSVITNNIYKNEPIQISQVRVWAQQGQFKNPDNEAYCRLLVSKDVGVTYNIMDQQKMSPLGKRDSFIIFWGLGKSYRWTFKFEFYSDSPVVFMSAQMKIGELL